MENTENLGELSVAQKLLLGIRDNLLKPMALEIESKSSEEIKQSHQALIEKITSLESEINKIQQKLNCFHEELSKASIEVKW